MRRVLDFPPSRHTWSVSLRVQRCPTIASVPSSRPYATQSETPKESVAPYPRELTGENSPLYTYQPTKKKTDRVLAKYFCRWYPNAHQTEYPTPKAIPLMEGRD
jgi:hypothetical protein